MQFWADPSQIPLLAAVIAVAAVLGGVLTHIYPRYFDNPERPLGFDEWPVTWTWRIGGGIIAALVTWGLTFLGVRPGLLLADVIVGAVMGAASVVDYGFHRVPPRILVLPLIGVPLGILIDAVMTGNYVALLWALVSAIVVGFIFTAAHKAGLGGADRNILIVLSPLIGYHSGQMVLLWCIAIYAIGAVLGMMILPFAKAPGGNKMKAKMAFVPPIAYALVAVPLCIPLAANMAWFNTF